MSGLAVYHSDATVGKEPLVPLFAAQGCEIVATDQSYDAAQSTGWSQSNQYAGQIGSLNEKNLCDSQLFEKMVTFRTVDMRHIPKDLRGFDFTWSSCAFEHLGSIAAGLKFVLEQMECLSPGGIAVHTTEFNLGSNSETIEKGPTVLFRRRDLEKLSKKLKLRGNMVNLDFTPGSTEADLHVDSPPWSGTHLRLQHEGFIITSYGIVIKKGAAINKGAWPKTVSLLSGSKRR
ncbi:MAG: SAM-dependent methyltransferase [Acidimicrobiaceae bacterium]|nr:SAM-dependent methyltransferase [Acidimicrobiaceae bacterium]